MKNKIAALFLTLLFPFLHLLVRYAARPLALAAALARVRARSPGLDEEFLLNQAKSAVRLAEPWLFLATAALTLLIIFIALRFSGSPIRAFIKTGRLGPAAALRLVQIALGLCVALNAMISLLPKSWMDEYSDRVSAPLSAAGPVMLFLCTVIAAPLVEEVIFRGLCFRFLRRAFPPSMANLWQALLFAAFHGTKLQLIYAFPAGLVLGLAYLRCGTLAAPVILHMAFNAAGFFHLPLPDPVWGRFLWLLTGTLITVLGLRALRVKEAARSAPANTSPHPPRQ